PVAAVGAPQIDITVITSTLCHGVGAVHQHDFVVAEYGVKPVCSQKFCRPIAIGAAVDQAADRKQPVPLLIEAYMGEQGLKQPEVAMDVADDVITAFGINLIACA